ncbi:nucleotidyltransferase family protein [Cereibacter azotoformans]|uniref:MurNAc alpha-1-phosphate uridylyltransferase n=1 Tax=Cereibacter azotoformans TaxID=43057 RepID=A0A2T5K2U0_9RHOB|nr:nucleotidyltransferase family protein [Cereibacter azotoformans]AXQ94667.1 nucleotidyltransferase family protein [Cereibacter sphaeroides]MBO4170484.1 nucleotidyltransferase family protein [Cereibacter azotoformans]PTR16753.1 MurNAc alpha-1-phosphate uridylyltransferase [Cereibacter azotoformans]UIJ30228.1 nucleotidyltransferase family protein [Cereibacter azotoformans]
MRPDAVMIFAAGFGTRMGALTATRPKPMIEVAGRPLIDHALALAEAAGVARIVANTHYLPATLQAHLAGRAHISHEEEILETGGGLRHALPLLGRGPVFTLNSDAVWTGENPLDRLAQGWSEGMEALLLLAPSGAARGDFTMDAGGRIARPQGAPGYTYLGAQILRTERLAAVNARAFSLNLIWDQMIEAGTAFGLVHRGGWCDVGRPEGIAEAEAMLTHA